MAKPTLALIPSAQGSKFYSVLPSNGVGDFDFTRSGSATRINKDGLIETVATGVSRLNYPMIDGVVNGCPSHLLEPTRMNLNTKSEDIEGFSQKTNVTITNNQTTSPDGNINASNVIPINVNNIHQFQNAPISFISGVDYTVSAFVKANGYDYFSIKFASTDNVFSDDLAWFNVSTGTTGTISSNIDGTSIEDYGNGWYKITATQQANATGNGKIFLGISNADNTPIFLGNGSSGIYLWGYQVEQGSYATSYIPTSGSAVTRSSETANGSGDASTFNDSEGVLMAEIKSLDSSDTSSRRLGITKDGTYEGLRLQLGSGNISVTVYDGTTNQYNKTVNIDNSIFHKVALKYKTNDFALWIDGIEYFPQLSGSTFVNGTLDDISFDYVGGSPFRGSTKQLQYFDSALNDSDLETLTSWTSFTDMANGQLYSIK